MNDAIIIIITLIVKLLTHLSIICALSSFLSDYYLLFHKSFTFVASKVHSDANDSNGDVTVHSTIAYFLSTLILRVRSTGSSNELKIPYFNQKLHKFWYHFRPILYRSITSRNSNIIVYYYQQNFGPAFYPFFHFPTSFKFWSTTTLVSLLFITLSLTKCRVSLFKPKWIQV